jgi:hypothetical protein
VIVVAGPSAGDMAAGTALALDGHVDPGRG